MFTSLNKTDAKQIHPAIENLHMDALDIRNQEGHLEEENRELRRMLANRQELLDSLEYRVNQLFEDGSLKLTESDMHLIAVLREESKKLQLVRKARKKELSSIHKSQDYLKYMEHTVGVNDFRLKLKRSKQSSTRCSKNTKKRSRQVTSMRLRKRTRGSKRELTSSRTV
jgi:hypothetical protein